MEKVGAYSRAVVDGDWVFVSGCGGHDYVTGAISEDVAEQAAQAFRNIASALDKAGAELADVVRISLILSDAADYPKVAPVLRDNLDKVRPACTAWVAPLMDPRMKIEIEVTARHDRQASRS
ncbi:Enamine/imine deaminase [Oceanibacterium hippocampi]|uniref:Enamine/imine deaminase n=2 Tax=Oceanibacterium hippocampi TaxID=745714 RepID=A0A1Y5TPU9_9PROT|nr:Enamine/imine deaminase [Oceanibacterium hippocampi]